MVQDPHQRRATVAGEEIVLSGSEVVLIPLTRSHCSRWRGLLVNSRKRRRSTRSASCRSPPPRCEVMSTPRCTNGKPENVTLSPFSGTEQSWGQRVMPRLISGPGRKTPRRCGAGDRMPSKSEPRGLLRRRSVHAATPNRVSLADSRIRRLEGASRELENGRTKQSLAPSDRTYRGKIRGCAQGRHGRPRWGAERLGLLFDRRK